MRTGYITLLASLGVRTVVYTPPSLPWVRTVVNSVLPAPLGGEQWLIVSSLLPWVGERGRVNVVNPAPVGGEREHE